MSYDIAEGWEHMSTARKSDIINRASKEQLEKWASDPDCNQSTVCVAVLAKGEIRAGGVGPFNPRTEVSADARYIAGRIITHLWIIFVALPFVLAVLFLVLKNG